MPTKIQKLKNLITRKYNQNGEEIMDATPIAVPSSYRHPPTLQEQMARYMRAAQLDAQNQGAESFEEADDFDIGDDYDPESPHELVYDQELGKEMPQAVKHQLDHDREKFNKFVSEKRAQQRKFKNETPKSKKKEKPSEEEED